MVKGVFSIMPNEGTPDDRYLDCKCDPVDGSSEEKIETFSIAGGV